MLFRSKRLTFALLLHWSIENCTAYARTVCLRKQQQNGYSFRRWPFTFIDAAGKGFVSGNFHEFARKFPKSFVPSVQGDSRQGARRPLHPLNRALWRKILLFFGNLRQNLHLTPACPPESSASGNHTVSSLDALPLFACGFFPLPVNANRGGNVPL